jgi:L-ascorbate metabolism protein UlaG (beta-lactamase superfamily)
MLPINGRDFYRFSRNVIGNMNSKEAVKLARDIRAKLLIPMHFDLYKPNGENPANFVSELYEAGIDQPFHMFMPGERYIYTAD